MGQEVLGRRHAASTPRAPRVMLQLGPRQEPLTAKPANPASADWQEAPAAEACALTVNSEIELIVQVLS
jgi:hypothetical protein